jgi:hypothetical protein
MTQNDKTKCKCLCLKVFEIALPNTCVIAILNVMLNGTMLNVILLNVIMLNVIMLNVSALCSLSSVVFHANHNKVCKKTSSLFISDLMYRKRPAAQNITSLLLKSIYNCIKITIIYKQMNIKSKLKRDGKSFLMPSYG